jgi:hypothetical protein
VRNVGVGVGVIAKVWRLVGDTTLVGVGVCWHAYNMSTVQIKRMIYGFIVLFLLRAMRKGG